MSKLIIALDTADIRVAVTLAGALIPYCAMFKLGLEFFTAHGPAGIRQLAHVSEYLHGCPIMLDLKLHDIPNTVGHAVLAVCQDYPRFITVHASGGEQMIKAAVDASYSGQIKGLGRPEIIAVTVLTSLDQDALNSIGVYTTALQHVVNLAILAIDAGADGIVCSPQEVGALRRELGPDVILVVRGIRPAGTDTNDQARSAIPRAAADAGADFIVVGKPITQAPDPIAAAAAIAAEIA